ncbi:MAG: hypothetical protein J1E40_09055, partial [Oscillospiraceae bacterium]|nr:hypothetical protein [Oscillospiraceae bacterium]
IELSKTLLHFIEFDFTYFWEQCIEAGRTARKTGRLPQNIVASAKQLLGRAHPYIEACLSTDFSEIVTDCIIEYICHSERIGLEELWARCISPKNPYETAIFRRISEYKTNRATNRWTSIVRLQEYARNKTDFVFSPQMDGKPISSDLVRARKEYFDLQLSVAANELGCPPEALPSMRLCSPASLPNAAFAVRKVSKNIYTRLSDVLSQAQDMASIEGINYGKIRDQIAMDVYASIRNVPPPGELDMKIILDAIKENPSELYFPDSFKSIIDLEFDLMYKREIFLRKCENCGRFFTVTDDNPRCDRVNSSGKTCRQQYEELYETIAMEAKASAEEELREIAAASAEAEPAEEDIPEEIPESISPEPVPEPEPEPEPEPVPEPPKLIPVTITPEMEKRSQKLYNALYKRVGRGFEENEFREWSQYLSNMKKNLKIGEGSLKQFNDFMEYSDKLLDEVKLASKNKTVHIPTEKPYGRKRSRQGEEDAQDQRRGRSVRTEQITNDTHKVPQVEATVVSSKNVEIKPFKPQAFDSLFDAVKAYENESFDDENEEPENRPQKPVKISAPTWERLSREDVYGKKD